MAIVDEVARRLGREPNEERKLIEFVKDRPGHDQRYAIDASRVAHEIGWLPRMEFQEGIRSTVDWYLEREDWCREVATDYAGERVGELS